MARLQVLAAAVLLLLSAMLLSARPSAAARNLLAPSMQCLPENTGASQPCSPPGNDAYPQCCPGLVCTSPPGCPSGSCALGCFKPATPVATPPPPPANDNCLPLPVDGLDAPVCGLSTLSPYPKCCDGLKCMLPPDCPAGSCAPRCYPDTIRPETCLGLPMNPLEAPVCGLDALSPYPKCCKGLKCMLPPDCPVGSCAPRCYPEPTACTPEWNACTTDGACCAGHRCLKADVDCSGDSCLRVCLLVTA